MYKHTQIGWLIIIPLTISLLFILIFYFMFLGNLEIPQWARIEIWVVFFIILACLFLFGTLTVTVDNQGITASFGIGLIRSKHNFMDISSVEIVKNKWWYGWGIRYVSKGWIFNVSGLDAIELKKANGKVFRIGTDEPQKLKDAIQAKLKR